MDTAPQIMCEVEFKESVRIGNTVFNGPTEMKHADNSMTRHPADRAGLPKAIADIIVQRNWGKILREGRDIPNTLGLEGDPQLGLSGLLARLVKLEEENAELKRANAKKN